MIVIGVIGSGDEVKELNTLAEEVGFEIGRSGSVTLNGGLGGVMRASAMGAKRAGGLTIGFLPGLDPAQTNPFIDIPVPTGLGDMRNFLIVRASHALIAIGGGFGTLSEIAIALKMKRPVIGVKTDILIDNVLCVESPKRAVSTALSLIK